MRPWCRDGRRLCRPLLPRRGAAADAPLSLLPGLSRQSVAAVQPPVCPSPNLACRLSPPGVRRAVNSSHGSPARPVLPTRSADQTTMLASSNTRVTVRERQIEARAGGRGERGRSAPRHRGCPNQSTAGFFRRKDGRSAAVGARKPRCRQTRCQRKTGKT